jgi:hypothetical protein
MIYYRVAFKKEQTPAWKWQSSLLTSLDTVFGFLRMYRCVSRDCIRVFLSSSPEKMDELLSRENMGLVSNSITVEQLMCGYCVNSLEIARLELELQTGGDHDIPNEFTPPSSMQQRQQWARLLAKVQAGEIVP